MKKVAFEELQMNPMQLIGNTWMLLTAGNENSYNTMTVSWGHLGCVWGKPTAVIYVRPQRYTKEFIDREDVFTLSVLGEEYKKQLAYLGSHSGRDGDKVKAAGITPIFHDGTVSFAESKMTLVCRKLYRAPIIAEGFIDRELIDEEYPKSDYHDMYVAEIIAAYTSED